jgi:hypothetical protein
MNIQTVATNLRVTIAGKEKYRATLGNTRYMNDGAAMATEATRSMLEINIGELKRILQDVEQCLPKSDYSLDGPMIKMFRED